MALATRCPHCHTTFRVAHDQLKLRAGLVRCGSCKEIFNGIEHLLASESVAATQTPTPAAAPSGIAPATPAAPAASAPVATREHIPETPAVIVHAPAPAPIDAPAAPQLSASAALDFVYPEADPEPEAQPDPIPDTVVELKSDEPVEVEFIEVPRKTPLPTPAVIESEPAAVAHAEAPSAPQDPLQRMTLVDLSEELPEEHEAAAHAAEAALPEATDTLDQVMAEFERKPPRGKKKNRPHVRSPLVNMPEEAPAAPAPVQAPASALEEAAEETDEPEFIRRERHKQGRGRTVRIAMNVASVLLLLSGLGQAAYIFRDQIAARVPEAKPVLQSACAALDCRIDLPTQIDAISIESDQLETLTTRKDTSELSLLLRNSGSTVQAWPQLELTLNDSNNIPLARRVFAPREYLPAANDPQKGFGANSEQAVKVYFEFADAKPAGYHVGVFYR